MVLHHTYKPWIQAPSEGLLEFLSYLAWKKPANGSAGRDVAALMIYMSMLYFRTQRKTEELDNTENREESAFAPESMEHIAALTYEEIAFLTGLSRSLIAQGLQRLVDLGKIKATGSHQKRVYEIDWPSGRWFKLPCRAILNRNGVLAFKTFTLRSKHELHALKIYLYLASVRDGSSIFSQASYEVISQRLGVQERDIRKAINLLISSGLLARVNRETDRINSTWGPNQYYLTGYADFTFSNYRPLVER